MSFPGECFKDQDWTFWFRVQDSRLCGRGVRSGGGILSKGLGFTDWGRKGFVRLEF